MSVASLDNNPATFDVDDVEYLRHGGRPLMARVFRPHGPGPYPALVECHAGAWCKCDRTTEHLRHEFMASHGIVSIALDFRSGNEHPYPASVQDINFAVRWAKARAGELKTRPDLIGISGQSSGGHLAMLVAMQPRDVHYAAVELPPSDPAQDASVRFAVLSWPVINPLSRYRHAQRALKANGRWAESVIASHDAYWLSEANMAEGNPMLALERGEKVQTPPAIWFQPHDDIAHDYADADAGCPDREPQRFVANYRRAGGEIDLKYINLDMRAGHAPDLSKCGDAFMQMVKFVRAHTNI